MSEKRIKTINSRIILKHAIEEDWKKSSLVPLEGEIIIYDPDENHSYIRYKRGNGSTSVNNLSFEPYIHIGAEAPANPSVGMLWLETTVDLRFYLDYYNHEREVVKIEECIAAPGMTFRDWVNSDYNTGGWVCMPLDPENGELEADEGDHVNGIGLNYQNDPDFPMAWIVNQKVFSPWGNGYNVATDCESEIVANKHYDVWVDPTRFEVN